MKNYTNFINCYESTISYLNTLYD